jgi:hypothetical protein
LVLASGRHGWSGLVRWIGFKLIYKRPLSDNYQKNKKNLRLKTILLILSMLLLSVPVGWITPPPQLKDNLFPPQQRRLCQNLNRCHVIIDRAYYPTNQFFYGCARTAQVLVDSACIWAVVGIVRTVMASTSSGLNPLRG